MSRRVLLAAGGAVLLTSTAAALAADARARSAGTQLRPAADGAAGRTSTRASAPSRPGEASPATSPRQQPQPIRHATRPPQKQPQLPYGEPMYTVEDGPKVVALTIDDGPSPIYTPQVLKILRRYGVIASFSMIGRNAAAFPGVAREVAAAGHMVVNHTWNHYNLRGPHHLGACWHRDASGSSHRVHHRLAQRAAPGRHRNCEGRAGPPRQ